MRKVYCVLGYLVSIIQGVQTYFMGSVWIMSIGILILFQENQLVFESSEQQKVMFLNMSNMVFSLVLTLEILTGVLHFIKGKFCLTKWIAKQVAIAGCFYLYKWYGNNNTAVFNSINMEYVLIFAFSIIVMQHLLAIAEGMVWRKIRPVEVKSMGTACMVNETKVDEEGRTTDSESE